MITNEFIYSITLKITTTPDLSRPLSRSHPCAHRPDDTQPGRAIARRLPIWISQKMADRGPRSGWWTRWL